MITAVAAGGGKGAPVRVLWQSRGLLRIFKDALPLLRSGKALLYFQLLQTCRRSPLELESGEGGLDVQGLKPGEGEGGSAGADAWSEGRVLLGRARS